MINGPDPIGNYRENDILIPGQWYVMGEYKSDHRKFVGHSISKNEYNELIKTYKSHLSLLWTLPK